jgi:nucleoside-diphosphate-sugar epimerase
MAPFKFIDRVSRGVEIQQFGDGSSSRGYTYIDDIVDGVVRAIDHKHKYEVFNLGEGTAGASMDDFIDLVQEHTGKKATIKVMPDQPGACPTRAPLLARRPNSWDTLPRYPSKISSNALSSGTTRPNQGLRQEGD